MLNRRSFLKSTSLALPALVPAIRAEQRTPNELERIVARCKSLDILGRPRSWSEVQDGFFPIPPERVVVMTNQGGDGWCHRNRTEEESLREAMKEPFTIINGCGEHPVPYRVHREKLTLIFRMMRVLTDYYRVPDLFPKWAKACAQRESLASTGYGWGFAMPHQFQSEGTVLLTNPPVDWWLILFPEGTIWNACDEKPVFGMIAHVFPMRHSELPGLSLRVWALTEGIPLGMKPDEWKQIAQMDRIAAVQAINRQVLMTVARSRTM